MPMEPSMSSVSALGKRKRRGVIIRLGSFRCSEVKLGWQDTIADILPPTPLKCPGDLIYRYVEGLQWVMHHHYSRVALWEAGFSTISTLLEFQVCVHQFGCWMLLMLSIIDLRGCLLIFSSERHPKPYQQLLGVFPVASMDHAGLSGTWLTAFGHDLQLTVFQRISCMIQTHRFLTSTLSSSSKISTGKSKTGRHLSKLYSSIKRGCWRYAPCKSTVLWRYTYIFNSSSWSSSHPPKRENGTLGGSTMKFSFNPTLYPSSPPELLPPLYRCTCKPEPFHLPTLDGLHVIPGLCNGVFLRTEAPIPQNTSIHGAAGTSCCERPWFRKILGSSNATRPLCQRSSLREARFFSWGNMPIWGGCCSTETSFSAITCCTSFSNSVS